MDYRPKTYNILKNYRRKSSRSRARQGVLRLDTKIIIHKKKIWQVRLHHLHFESPHKEDEEINYRLRENFYKPHIQKGVVFRLYKESSKLYSKKTNNPIMKWAKDTKRYFNEEDTQIANKP